MLCIGPANASVWAWVRQGADVSIGSCDCVSTTATYSLFTSRPSLQSAWAIFSGTYFLLAAVSGLYGAKIFLILQMPIRIKANLFPLRIYLVLGYCAHTQHVAVFH